MTPNVDATISIIDPSISRATAGVVVGRVHPVICERAFKNAPRIILPCSDIALSLICVRVSSSMPEVSIGIIRSASIAAFSSSIMNMRLHENCSSVLTSTAQT